MAGVNPSRSPAPHGSAADLPPVVVLLGGPSAEHDVSVVSGTAIAAALADAGSSVRQVLIDLDGRWWWLPAGPSPRRPAGSGVRRPDHPGG